MSSRLAVIQIPVAIKSRNEIDKMHFQQKLRLRKEYQLLIRNRMTIRRIRAAKPGEKFKLYITTYRKRKLDWDNLVGGAKQLIDALSNEGFIWDDAIEYIGGTAIEQLKAKDEEFTIICRTTKA